MADKFQQLTVYVAVAEEESFAGAGRRLGMSPPAVTRFIATLEETLGVKLLDRTTRFVRPTDAGLRYLYDARQILERIQEADEGAAGINAAPRGHLTITAPVLFGKSFVMPHVVEFLKMHSEVEISALFLDRIVNMMEEGVEVGIRIGVLPDSSMHAVRVGQVRRVFCASPAYLEEFGTPEYPKDLLTHNIVSARSGAPIVEWKFGDGEDGESIRLKPRLIVTTNDAAINAVRLGTGITRLLSYQVSEYLESGELKTVLSSFETPPLPIHVVHRERRGGSAKIRSFVDFIASRLRENKTLQP